MMRRDYFIYNGVNSLDYGVWFVSPETEVTPERDIVMTAIPGRSGDLLDDSRRWNNVEIVYRVAIVSDFLRNYSDLYNHLLSGAGYYRLEDSIRPNEFRLATVIAPIEPETSSYHQTGEFDITFYCKPQRYLKSGETSIAFLKPGTIRNPTLFPAAPLIEVHGNGSGTVSISGQTVTINSITDTLMLDCDLQNAYNKDGNQNLHISAPEFPLLKPGENTVSFTGGVTDISIKPRWWKL